MVDNGEFSERYHRSTIVSVAYAARGFRDLDRLAEFDVDILIGLRYPR